MKRDAFDKYLYSKNIKKDKEVELELSDSSHEPKQQNTKNNKTRQLKITQIFNNRSKNKNNSQTHAQINSSKNGSEVHQRFQPNNPSKNKQVNQFPDAKKQIWDNIIKQQAKLNAQLKAIRQVPIYTRVQRQFSKQKRERQSNLQLKNKAIQQQKRLKRQRRKQQQKKKKEEILKKKALTFKNFLHSYDRNHDADKLNKNEKTEKSQLNNAAMFNKIQQDAIQKNNIKANVGLSYKKITIQKQKIPISFLKMLLSYKFSNQFPKQQVKKVPNQFQDQLMYKKIFHYLIINQCIADIHLRLKAIQQNSPNSLSISISNFKNNSEGFIQFNLIQNSKDSSKPVVNQKQKFALKNLSLSRNRLGLITNAKNFKLQHFGLPSPKNERIFGFLCILITPESKQELNSQTKAVSSISIQSLDLIQKLNKTNKCYYYDLQKISTHIRQYMAVTHLYDTQVSAFIYNPKLIQNNLQLIEEQDRQMLQPILQRLKLQFNSTQYQSIRQMALRDSGIVLLQGPPGTGKTTTLMGLLAAQFQYLKNICHNQQKRKILICAPSNAAINHITKRIVSEGLISASGNTSLSFSLDGSLNKSNLTINSERVFPKVLRVGIVQTDDQDIIKVSLDDIIDRKMNKAKTTQNKMNNMTTTQLKQQTIILSKEINKLRARKDIQQWEKQSKINSLKYEIKKYDNLMFNFRKQRIQMKQLCSQIQNNLFQQADIILTTLSSSGNDKMQKIRGFIGCLIVDQAAQATQPNILIPLQTGVKKVLLIGDPCQLPSTTMSQDSSTTLFNRSLFQRFLDNGVKPYFLNIQYRMAPAIREFPSRVFYSNRLIDDQSVSLRYKGKQATESQQNSITQQSSQKKLNVIQNFFNRNSIFVDVKFGQQQFHSNSYRNIGECIVIKSFVMHFIKNTDLSIGIITPYQAQRKYLIKQLKIQIQQKEQLSQKLQKYIGNNSQCVKNQGEQMNVEQNSGINIQNQLEEGQILKQQELQKQQKNQTIQTNKQDSSKIQKKQDENSKLKQKQQRKTKTAEQLLQQRVMINTVDSFQGQEKDIIIVSTVRSNNKRDIGFMKDERRINVALTRSRHLLIVIGNGDTIGSNQIWNKYLQWSEQHKCYYQIKQRQGVKLAISKINKGYNQSQIERIRHTKFTKDLRKQERDLIKRQDFGLAAKARKKIKRQIAHDYEYQLNKQKNSIQNTTKVQNNDKQIKNEIKVEDIKKAEQLIEQKRAREQQAINLQEVNRRVKQLQQRMKMQGDNPYARLFD